MIKGFLAQTIFMLAASPLVQPYDGDTNLILQVQVGVEDCKGCGMSEENGQFSVWMQTEDSGCTTGNLDNPNLNDYMPGEMSTFSGRAIGSCYNFDIGPHLEEDIQYVTMATTHKGNLHYVIIPNIT